MSIRFRETYSYSQVKLGDHQHSFVITPIAPGKWKLLGAALHMSSSISSKTFPWVPGIVCLTRLVQRNLEWTWARSFPSSLFSRFGALSTLPCPQPLAVITAVSHQAFAGRECAGLVLFPYQISQYTHHSQILPLDVHVWFFSIHWRHKKVLEKVFSGRIWVSQRKIVGEQAYGWQAAWLILW